MIILTILGQEYARKPSQVSHNASQTYISSMISPWLPHYREKLVSFVLFLGGEKPGWGIITEYSQPF